jgi:hypothetical protein
MGYPVEIFATPSPDSSTCAICHEILEDAVSMKECYSCPNCHTAVTGTNPNYYARESIGALEIKCLNGHSIAD